MVMNALTESYPKMPARFAQIATLPACSVQSSDAAADASVRSSVPYRFSRVWPVIVRLLVSCSAHWRSVVRRRALVSWSNVQAPPKVKLKFISVAKPHLNGFVSIIMYKVESSLLSLGFEDYY